MKVVLCLQWKASGGGWPDGQKLVGQWGHKLVAMRDEIIAALKWEGYNREDMPNPRLVSELRDAKARKLLRLLSQFADQGRYFHLNIVGGSRKQADWVEQQWLQATLDPRAPDAAGIPANGLYRIRGAEQVVAILEKLAKALCQALLGIAAHLDAANAYRAHVAPFHALEDAPLGQTDYRAW